MLLSALALSLGLAADAPPASPAMPDTDIYLYRAELRDGRLELSGRRPLSAEAGYENQPAFSPDGKALLFTAQRDGKQTEIFRHELASGHTTALTRTAESEYSPRYADDMRSFSVVRVEADGTQRLWRFAADGTAPSLVLKDIKPVGYYAFDGREQVYAFVLGEPHTLQRIALGSEKAEVLARDIGRSLLPAPGGGIGYVQMGKDGPILHRIGADGADAVQGPLFEDSEGDFAWDGAGAVLSTQGTKLFRREGSGDWQEVVFETGNGDKLSRVALSPDGRWLALVSQKP
ncbi:MAG: PD40 domain-containing protein [Gammaproteobacteria bacterium]|nr:PD40 domain-containing protein [Gammaproteobacteria bacterium]